METKENEKLSTPLAIVFAGILIAGAVLYTQTDSKSNPNQLKNQPSQPDKSALLEKINPVSEIDHVRGDKNAEVTIVEYSDTECPYCKQFHQTMKQIFGEYNGKVAWVYRHFPIDQLHPKARHEAVALECANELGGNEKFWQFTDKVYEITPSNNGLDPAELPKIAKDLGLDTIAFAKCLASTKYDSLIESNAKNGSLTGGDGTPWSILITKGGKKYPISGAQPYSVIKQIIESALKNN